MPHDKNGTLLEPGDRVMVMCEIKTITLTEEYCNLTVKTVEVMPPYTGEDGRTTIVLNAKQVEKVIIVA